MQDVSDYTTVLQHAYNKVVQIRNITKYFFDKNEKKTLKTYEA
jgi:hypothetical protein